jgi:hypothetical protein
MRPPKSWKEFDLADRTARRAVGLENADVVQQTLIHINELDAEQPIEAKLVTEQVIEASVQPGRAA